MNVVVYFLIGYGGYGNPFGGFGGYGGAYQVDIKLWKKNRHQFQNSNKRKISHFFPTRKDFVEKDHRKALCSVEFFFFHLKFIQTLFTGYGGSGHGHGGYGTVVFSLAIFPKSNSSNF